MKEGKYEHTKDIEKDKRDRRYDLENASYVHGILSLVPGIFSRISRRGSGVLNACI